MSEVLTKREQEVMALVAEGWASKEIAPRLYISTATVNTHLKNIYYKLQVNNRVAALRKSGLWLSYAAAQ